MSLINATSRASNRTTLFLPASGPAGNQRSATHLVIETGEVLFRARGHDDDVESDYIIEFPVGPRIAAAANVVPTASVSEWHHDESDTDDNSAWRIGYPNWETKKEDAGGERIYLRVDISVLGEHASVRSLQYSVAIEVNEIVGN